MNLRVRNRTTNAADSFDWGMFRWGFKTQPDFPTPSPPMTETLTTFFCFLENPLNMLNALVAVFWHGGVFGEDIESTVPSRDDTIITSSSEIRCFYPPAILSQSRGLCSLAWANEKPVEVELTNKKSATNCVLFGGRSSLEADQSFHWSKILL